MGGGEAATARALLLPPDKALRGITGLGPVSSANCMLLALQANNSGHRTGEWLEAEEKIKRILLIIRHSILASPYVRGQKRHTRGPRAGES